MRRTVTATNVTGVPDDTIDLLPHPIQISPSREGVAEAPGGSSSLLESVLEVPGTHAGQSAGGSRVYQNICRLLVLVAVCVAASATNYPPGSELEPTSAPPGTSAITNPAVATGGDPGARFDATLGRALYSRYCEACHQAGGAGLPGAFPPLKGSAVVNRDDATKHLQVVLQGLQGARVSGVVYTNAMPPFATILSDTDIAAIVDYERTAWGNHGRLVSAGEVGAERVHAE